MFTLIKDSQQKYEVEIYESKIPRYAKRRFPEIYKLLKDLPLKDRLSMFFRRG
ncbi:hypothetical protein KCTC32516_00536 [Polaribacter huanghezhanensis]|nr:hypothetical protein KCTC32516_00536 [Polaribacter huanghezhanensis]